MECEVSVGGLLNHCHSTGYVRIAPLSSFLLVVKLPSLQKNWRRRLWLMSIVIGYSASGDYAKILKGFERTRSRKQRFTLTSTLARPTELINVVSQRQ